MLSDGATPLIFAVYAKDSRLPETVKVEPGRPLQSADNWQYCSEETPLISNINNQIPQ